MATTKVRPQTGIEAAEAAVEAAQAGLVAAEAEMANQDALERRLRQEWSAHDTPGVVADTFKAKIRAARETYNDAYRAAEVSRQWLGDAKRALGAAKADAARLPLPEARLALQQAEATLATLDAEQAGLGTAQRAAAERGDVADIAGIMARRDQLPHRRVAAEMALLTAREQVYLAEADELEASLPALTAAVEETVPALQQAQAVHAEAMARASSAGQDVAFYRQSAREARRNRLLFVENLAQDRGPVVRSTPHAGRQA